MTATATTAKTATTAEIAAALDTTPRELRKYLRDADKGVGKGARYSLPNNARSVEALRKRFTAWSASQAALKAAKETAKHEAADDEVADDTDD